MSQKYRILLCLLVFLVCFTSVVYADIVRNPEMSVYPQSDQVQSLYKHAPRPLDISEQDDLLEIWFGKVSVCDCIAVRCHGQTMLIDGGNRNNGAATMAFMSALSFTHADYLFNTHHHDDHLEMQEALLRRGLLTADVFLTPYPQGYNVEAQKQMEATVLAHNVEYRQIFDGDVLYLGGETGARIEFHRWLGSTNANFSSVFAKITYGERSIWLMADVISAAQKAIAEERTDIVWKADLLKAGHHGYTVQDEKLLRLIDPEFTIITSSRASAKKTIDQMNTKHIPWLVTNAGTIYMWTDGGPNWYWNQD